MGENVTKRKKILIAAGIYPPQIGGPAYYAKSLQEAFENKGHEVSVATYTIERALPMGVRHFFYFVKILPRVTCSNYIIALDTFSVGLPSVLAARLLGKRIIIRIGGDFLWESHVNRTGEKMTLPQFYEEKPVLSLKEKLIFRATRFVLHEANALVFSTDWQRMLWVCAYGIDQKKTHIIENFYGPKEPSFPAERKTFLWAGRDLVLKNVVLLREAFAEAQKTNPDIELEAGQFEHEELMKKMKQCYAVILPSLSDVSPNFILDAIRFNKTFICTKETGLYDKLKDVGLFTNPMDKDDIKEKILFLADDNNYAEYKRRVGSFDFTHLWEEIATEFLKLLYNPDTRMNPNNPDAKYSGHSDKLGY